jgi:hypothetical protein
MKDEGETQKARDKKQEIYEGGKDLTEFFSHYNVEIRNE